MINKDVRKSLVCKKGNYNPIWSWNNSQVPFHPIFLPVISPYVGSYPATLLSTVHISTIVGGQMSNSEISHDGKDRITVQPRNDHMLPL